MPEKCKLPKKTSPFWDAQRACYVYVKDIEKALKRKYSVE